MIKVQEANKGSLIIHLMVILDENFRQRHRNILEISYGNPVNFLVKIGVNITHSCKH